MDAALRYEIEQAIPELKNEIYPTNAPETSKKPYLVYYKHRSGHIKTLDGYTKNRETSYLFNVMATRYYDMNRILDIIETLLSEMPKRTIGSNGLHVEDLTINNIGETYEHNLCVYRGIIDFTIYF